MTREEIEQLAIGTPVIVSDGKPRPPAHHKRKVRSWEARNYAGTLDGVELGSAFGDCARVEVPTKGGIVAKIVSLEPISRIQVAEHA